MDLPALHKARRGYWIGNYPLQLIRTSAGWQITVRRGLKISAASVRWLREQNLEQRFFPSRQDALTAFWSAAVTANEEPLQREEPICVKKDAAHYDLANNWKAVREAGQKRWAVYTELGSMMGWVSTLWQAASVAQDQDSRCERVLSESVMFEQQLEWVKPDVNAARWAYFCREQPDGQAWRNCIRIES